MKDFVSQELKGLKQEHRLLSLRRNLGEGALGCTARAGAAEKAGAWGSWMGPAGQGRGCWRVLIVPAEPFPLQSFSVSWLCRYWCL